MEKLLIVDDEESITDLVRRILESYGHTCACAENADQARNLLSGGQYAVMICDINMPGESGLELLRETSSSNPEMGTILMTGLPDMQISETALALGAYDYILKPFDHSRLIMSVASALIRRKAEIANRNHKQRLEEAVTDRTRSLQHIMQQQSKTLDGIIHALALTVETRDPYTSGHQKRVASLAGAIAREHGLSAKQLEGLHYASIIHDLGKISIPSEILSKPCRLSENEFNLIKEHPKVGYEILKDIDFPWPIATMVLQHHERYDGSGYPSGLAAEDILIESRIMAVADVFEAIASHRPYRPSLGVDVALAEISRHRGRLYDPLVVDDCLKAFKKKSFELIINDAMNREIRGRFHPSPDHSGLAGNQRTAPKIHRAAVTGKKIDIGTADRLGRRQGFRAHRGIGPACIRPVANEGS